MKFKGFGEVTLEKLGITSINELLVLEVTDLEAKGFSSLMANKLTKVISDRLEQGIFPNDFLAASSIPLIGDGTMRKLTFDLIENIPSISGVNATIGEKAARSLLDWIDDNEETIALWSPHFKTIIKSQKPEANGIVVCITGKLTDFSSRAKATTYLEDLGYEVKKSVTKEVAYLICETGSTGSSYQKAIKAGIPVLTIKQLFRG